VIPDFDAYCDFVAQLPENFSSIERSTLTVYTIGTHVAEVEGQVFFSGDYILSVWELLDLAERKISSYSYAVDRTGERLWWYDPQSHPDDPSLVSTDPHHKHIHPDIKHNRVTAPEISFSKPNLPFLIQEIEQVIYNLENPE
jgi:hypothetical protein